MKIRFAAGLAFVLALGLLDWTTAQARAPIIYVHGMNDTVDDYTKTFDLPALFRGMGYDLYVAATPRYGTIEERAKTLVDEIGRVVPEGPFHLLGHSMGGLDSRLALQTAVGARCLSLTTLATPHHGARMADVVVALADSPLGYLLGLIKLVFNAPLETTRELTTDFLERVFNPNVPDVPNVRYYSVAFAIPDPVGAHSRVPFISLMHRIAGSSSAREAIEFLRLATPQMAGDAIEPDVVNEALETLDARATTKPSKPLAPNDGLVTVQSAQWGQFLGVLTSDHWSETHPNRFKGGNSIEEIYGLVTQNLTQDFDN